jgi:phosphoribosyl-AMP cyclohydrolase
MENRIFLLHASQAYKLDGTFGLSDSQMSKMKELQDRKEAGIKPLTDNMNDELHHLIMLNLNPELPQTAKTFLNEWYSNDREEVWSKYTAKGHMVEVENIDFMAQVLDYGFAQKNIDSASDDYFAGTADVVMKDRISDIKSCWSKKTLFDVCVNGYDKAYELQGQVYMEIYKKKKFNLFYGLQDTPAEVMYSKEDVIYSDLPDNERFINFEFEYDEAILTRLRERIVAARVYLAKHHEKVTQSIGKTHVGINFKSLTTKTI